MIVLPIDPTTLAMEHLRRTLNEAVDHAGRALRESEQPHFPSRITDNVFIAVVRLTTAIQLLKAQQ